MVAKSKMNHNVVSDKTQQSSGRPQRIANKLDDKLIVAVKPDKLVGIKYRVGRASQFVGRYRKLLTVFAALIILVVASLWGRGYYMQHKAADTKGKNPTNGNNQYNVSTGTSHMNEEDTQKYIQKTLKDNPGIGTDSSKAHWSEDDGNVPE